ncbi:MAG: sigma-70 family RNA polymerase sigma factor, partial [Myxococcales bacterium]|nr:sigma-70 family RNA polymerase sigma factor [Myxococcales bacterium]
MVRRGFGSGQEKGTAPLSRHDPLAAYMRDVHRYALLTPEEEKDLALRYVESGDLDAARQLVTSNLRLVVKIAYDYRRAYKNLLDLVQEGNIGLMQAVKKFDPYKGVKLSTYAAWWIRAYMLRFILNNHRLVKVGTTQAQRKLFFNLKKEKARLSALGIEPTAERIAEQLNVSEDDVVQMDRRLAAGEASLDAPVNADDGRSVARVELLPSASRAVDDVLANEEVGNYLTDRIHEFGKT